MVKPENPRHSQITRESHPHFFDRTVFLIGNGKSRAHFDLERLRGKGVIIGCNALYRDFSPDILVGIDAKILKEIKQSGYGNKEHEVIVCPHNREYHIPNSYKWRKSGFNTSGCFAMMFAGQVLKSKEVLMLGMDAYPGNIYDNTVNYSKNTLQNFSGVTNYYRKALEESPETHYININDEDRWQTSHNNYMVVPYKHFEEVLKCR